MIYLSDFLQLLCVPKTDVIHYGSSRVFPSEPTHNTTFHALHFSSSICHRLVNPVLRVPLGSFPAGAEKKPEKKPEVKVVEVKTIRHPWAE